MANEIVVTVDDFRSVFPEFKDTAKYPNDVIQSFIDQAGCYVSRKNYGAVHDACRKLAIELAAAHLLQLTANASSPTGSGISGQVQSAHIGQVSVGMVVPPNKSQTQYWYNLTVYGQRLYQLLISKAPAGMFKFGTFQRVYWANVRGLGGVA